MNGNNSSDRFDTGTHRCIAHVALQHGVGILPKRRIGFDRCHSAHPGSDGPSLVFLCESRSVGKSYIRETKLQAGQRAKREQ